MFFFEFIYSFIFDKLYDCYKFIIIDNCNISYTGIYVFIKSSQFITYNLKIHAIIIIKKFIFMFFYLRIIYFSTNLILGILLKVIIAACRYIDMLKIPFYFIIIFKAQHFSLISHDLCKLGVHKRFELIKRYISTTHVIL